MITTIVPLELLLWLPWGADGQDDDTDESVDDDQDGDDGGQDDDQDQSATVPRSELLELQKKFDDLRRHLSAADKNKSAAQKKLDELQRKDRTDLENAQADLQRVQEEGQEWKGKFLSLARTNAFLVASAQANVQWHDQVVAQAAANLADLEVDDSGSVEGIDAVIKKLSKDKPFLVRTAEDSDDGDTEQRPKSGSRVGAKKKNTGTKEDVSREELLRRFPALRR